MRKLVLLAALATVLAAASPASAANFQSPSGNIRCVIVKSDGVRCDITERSFSPPPKPRSCDFDWGNSMSVGLRGRGRFVCVSDAVDGGRTLGFGEAIRRGRFRCRSRTNGIRCVNLRTSHGFALGRQRARRF